jgi:hypothetical protein
MTDTPEKPRGLWDVMKGSAPTEPEQSEPTAAGSNESEVLDEPQAADDISDGPHNQTSPTAEETKDTTPKGLWSVMQGSATEDVAPSDVERAASAPVEELPASEWTDESDAHSLDQPDPIPPIEPVVTTDSTPAYKQLKVKTGRSQKALAACLCGLLALPLSALALLPQAWLRLPATGVGFAAMMLGLLGWQDIRAARGRQTGIELALGGIALGVLSMFLGPILFARVGQGYRETFGRQQTVTNLETIGSALQSHHREKERFPVGGIFRVNPNGNQQPMHGWMTSLLPYMNQQELHRSINFDVPFDDPANRPAMRQTVSSFLAAGGSQDPVGRYKLAPAHFAGLGGDLSIEDVGLVKVGIFGRNSSMTRDDITDGLSQTFVAGEISSFYPAWGEPENWRMIGRGLNRGSEGFGNAADTGALFLKADGSVRFYSNDTDAKVLRQLSTPYAGESVPEHLR